MKIFVSGSLAYDRIMDFPGKFSDHILPDKIHILNVCFIVNDLKEKFGGTAVRSWKQGSCDQIGLPLNLLLHPG